MGYFANLAIEIEEAHNQGATPAQIAGYFNVPVAEVESILEMMNEADRDPVPQE